jgi:hypothetical protein
VGQANLRGTREQRRAEAKVRRAIERWKNLIFRWHPTSLFLRIVQASILSYAIGAALIMVLVAVLWLVTHWL